jgi:putative transposase
VLGLILSILAAIRVSFHGRSAGAVEVLALRRQADVLKRKGPRPPLTRLDRLFWLMLQRLWSGWAEVLVIVKPQTVFRWHRAEFRLYRRWCSRPPRGRPPIRGATFSLVRRLATENSGWGAPRIHGEILRFGYVVSEANGGSVSEADPEATGSRPAVALCSPESARGHRRF